MILHEIRKTKSYSGAVCPKGLLCSYVRDRRSDEDAHVDRCSQCGRLQVYKLKNSKIDDSKYRRDHLRDVLQRGSSLYAQIYGEPNGRAMSIFKSEEQKSQEFRENTEEVVRRAVRLENQGRL